MPRGLHVVAGHEELHPAGTRRQDAGERVVRPRHPVGVAGAGPHEGLHERAVVGRRAGPAGEQDGVGAVVEVDVLADRPQADSPRANLVEHPLALHEPGRGRDVEVRGPEVGLRVVDVELLARRIPVGHAEGLRPRHQVRGRGSGHRPVARTPLAVEPAVVVHVPPLRLAPEHRVAAVERVLQVADELRLRVERVERKAVRRAPEDESLRAGRIRHRGVLRTAHRHALHELHPLGRRDAGTRVEPQAAGEREPRLAGGRGDHVVGRPLGPPHQVERGLRPRRAAVAALGHAAHAVLVVLVGERPAAVVHQQPAVELDHRHAEVRRPLPGLVDADRRAARDRLVQPQARALEPVDEQAVDEQLPPRADRDRRLGRGGRCSQACHDTDGHEA